MVLRKNQDLKPSSPRGSVGGHILLMTNSNKNISNSLRQAGLKYIATVSIAPQVTHSDFGLCFTYSISVFSHSVATHLQGS